MYCARKPVLESLKLSTRFPKVAREWHPKFNRHLTPDNVLGLATQAAWWQCAKRKGHVFYAPIRSRTEDGLVCPFCYAHSIEIRNTFATKKTRLVKYWDEKKNFGLTPDDVPADSPIIVYFICPETANHKKPHTIRTSVNSATKEGLDCLGCKREHTQHLTIDQTHPKLAAQWHKTKNRQLKPHNVTVGSAMLVWWKCPAAFDHQWRCSVSGRTMKDTGCPYCSTHKQSSTTSFAVDRPDLLEQWHNTRNKKLDPHSIPSSYKFKVWWKCPLVKGHIWEASVLDRTAHNTGCHYCAGRIISKDNSLAAVYPQVAALWHPTKNGKLTPHDVTAGTPRRAYFQCQTFPDHFWVTAIGNHPTNCPKCKAYRCDKKTSIKALYPKIARQWHPTKNGPITPDNVSAGSAKKFWWVCPKNPTHEWECRVYTRTRNSTQCPICCNQLIIKENSLAQLHPEIAAQWHKKKNGALKPTQLAPQSHKKVWWKCKKGPDHEWLASIGDRVGLNSGCPFCSGRGFSVTQTLTYAHPELAKQWHPSKNEGVTPDAVQTKDNRSFWWICPTFEDHIWQSKIRQRIRAKTVCPVCASLRIRPGNTLQERYPAIAKEWHPTRNNGLAPNQIAGGSEKLVYWCCSKNSRHVWQAVIRSRTFFNNKCPHCKK
jgi:hypothetical protein